MTNSTQPRTITIQTTSRRRVLGIWFTRTRTYQVPTQALTGLEARAIEWTAAALSN